MWSAPGREKKKDKTKGWGRRYVLLRGGEAPQLEWRDPRESRQTRGNLNLALSTIDSQYARIRFSLPLSCLIVLPRFWVIVNLISNLLISFPSTTWFTTWFSACYLHLYRFLQPFGEFLQTTRAAQRSWSGALRTFTWFQNRPHRALKRPLFDPCFWANRKACSGPSTPLWVLISWFRSSVEFRMAPGSPFFDRARVLDVVFRRPTT